MKEMFSYQSSLPKIPIPDIKETCHRFMEWVQPLLTKEEYSNTGKVVDAFLEDGGDGEKLQNKLVEWAGRNDLSNWTAPLWYDIYLGARHPLIINGNVFYFLESKNPSELSQIHRATALALTVFRFKSLIDHEELTVDIQKGNPLSMDQYKKLFSSTRIPRRKKDQLKTIPFKSHMIVLHGGRIFKVELLAASGQTRSFLEIQEDLEYIITAGNQGQHMGVLTTMGRDEWADTRDSLLKNHPENKQIMEEIEGAVFALCLDDEGPTTLEDTSRMLLHGNGKNRWFDKSLQFIVFKNGRTGINFEHTGMDGSVMARMIRFIYEEVDKVPRDAYEKSQDKPKELTFYLDDGLEKTIKDAMDQFNHYIGNTQTRVLIFDKFGKDLIKTFHISPDAFVQLALQLAQYKLFGRCYSAYEAVMTRMFLQGRIEVMYGVSLESMAFIENMMSPNCDDQIRIQSFIKAARKHIDRANECRTGSGVDGHLFGLLNMYKRFGEDMGMDTLPELFRDKGYQILTHSTVCTSTSATQGIALAGYGPVVEDGFGIRYLNKPNAIHFNMTSRTAMEQKLEKMLFYIQESLVELADLMERNK